MTLDDVMTQDQAAVELRLGVSRVGQLLAAGELEAVPLGKRQKLVTKASVQALAKRRRDEAAVRYGFPIEGESA